MLVKIANREDPGQTASLDYHVFSCKCIFSLTMGCSNIKLCWCIGHIMSRVLDNILYNLDPLDLGVKVKSWIFL